MKKNKKTLKKLSLNKKVVSNLEKGQVSGGTIVSIVGCPVTVFCPRTVICPRTAICPRTVGCPPIRTIDCPSIVDGCGSALIC
ncbi:class I lanthipeptide [Kordia sp.]|uniref:class I lanthipeptide n=1 Tax=Kordia sp. TaxID=1965332 RepID=UPI003B5BF32F